MKNIFILIYIILTNFTFICTIDNLCKFKETLISETVEMDLRCGYKQNKFNYEEGVFISFSYRDSSSIVIFDGVNVKFPILSKENGYIPCEIDTVNNFIKITGSKDGLYWREDVHTNRVRVFYINVPDDKRNLYDELLDSFNILKPSG